MLQVNKRRKKKEANGNEANENLSSNCSFWNHISAKKACRWHLQHTQYENTCERLNSLWINTGRCVFIYIVVKITDQRLQGTHWLPPCVAYCIVRHTCWRVWNNR